MATSEVEICRLALSHIRAGSINALSEKSLQAQQCKLLYPNMRDMVLTAAPWGFAKVQAPLALRTDTTFGWAHLYSYPTDCLRINKLRLNFSNVSAGNGAYRPRLLEDLVTPDLGRDVEHKIYRVGGVKVIAANYPDLHIEYGMRVTEVTSFDIEFSMALSHLLASQLALPLVGGESGAAYMKNELAMYKEILSEAIASSLNETFSITPESEFIAARN